MLHAILYYELPSLFVLTQALIMCHVQIQIFTKCLMKKEKRICRTRRSNEECKSQNGTEVEVQMRKSSPSLS